MTRKTKRELLKEELDLREEFPTDEKGMTVVERYMLRVCHEFSRIVTKSRQMGLDIDFDESLHQITMLAEIQGAVSAGSLLSQRAFTDPNAAQAHLAKYEEADEQWLSKARTKKSNQLVGEALERMGMVPLQTFPDSPCSVCDQPMCMRCGVCHHCQKRAERPSN